MPLVVAYHPGLGTGGQPALRWRAYLLQGALIAGAYLAGVHLVAAVGGDTPEGTDGGVTTGPACVGCHHGGDDEGAGPDGGTGPGAVPMGAGLTWAPPGDGQSSLVRLRDGEVLALREVAQVTRPEAGR